MNKLPSLAAAALLLAQAAAPAFAHHSFAMFDQTKKVTIEGKISDIEWTNPHVWIHVDVAKDDGSVETWGIEMTSRVHLTRQHFPINDLAVGDAGVFVMSPYANGDPGGRFWTLETEKGVVFRDPSAQRQFESQQAAAQDQAAATP